jgi:3-hydroxybutyryl-CoA dehydrogenase
MNLILYAMIHSPKHHVVTVCGAGTMGSGIAYICLLAGHTVNLFDTNNTILDKAQYYIESLLQKRVEKGQYTTEQAQECRERLRVIRDTHECAESTIVIEAIIEHKDTKYALFREIEQYIAPTALVLSNTSSLPITLLSAGLQYPERFAGLHFFNPAPVMKLVEIIRGVRTAPATIMAVEEFARGLGKELCIARDVPGFVVNRVARNFYGEALHIAMENTASIEQIDRLVRSAGFKMGPFELMDTIGIDVNLAVTKSVWEQYHLDRRFAPTLMQEQYVQAGLLGRKTGRGFYDYTDTDTP